MRGSRGCLMERFLSIVPEENKITNGHIRSTSRKYIHLVKTWRPGTTLLYPLVGSSTSLCSEKTRMVRKLMSDKISCVCRRLRLFSCNPIKLRSRSKSFSRHTQGQKKRTGACPLVTPATELLIAGLKKPEPATG